MALADSGDVNDHPYEAQFQAFFEALSENREVARTGISDALETFRVLFACDLSAQEGRSVKLSEFK